MKTLTSPALLVLCLLLAACGNKGDLYIEPEELTAEQLELLEQLEKERAEKKNSKGAGDGAENNAGDSAEGESGSTQQ